MVCVLEMLLPLYVAVMVHTGDSERVALPVKTPVVVLKVSPAGRVPVALQVIAAVDRGLSSAEVNPVVKLVVWLRPITGAGVPVVKAKGLVGTEDSGSTVVCVAAATPYDIVSELL